MTQTKSITVGPYACSFLIDGRIGPIPAGHVVLDEEVAARVGVFDTPMIVPVLRSDEAIVLVDAGMGPGERSGELPAALAGIGIDVADVTHVLVTHLHADHAGGLTIDGKPTFPNARVHVAPADVAWARDNARGEVAMLDALTDAGLLQDLDGLPAEIEALDASGHTPGHTVFRAGSGSDSLLVGGDLVLIAEQIEDPTIRIALDDDHEAALASRRKILGEAASSGAWTSLYHLEPVVGHVTASGDAWAWSD